ncbi:MAG: CPBP family intramembrane metalloprotease [Lachnospiraceae bacterium]|nr:CPBP family intramembrane metalloprotease [Lachnospiraceae bacterium]
MNQKRPIVDRPYLGAILSIPLLYIIIPTFAAFITLIPEAILGKEVQTITTFCTAVAALIFLLIYKRHLRREKFKGVFSFTKAYKKDVFIAVFIAAIVDILCLLFGAIVDLGGLDKLVAPTITTICFGLFAGVLEETVFRAVPISIMMKNNPDDKRIIHSVILTSLIFGCVHFTNIGEGALLSVTITQVVFSLIVGIFWAAIYLRTGSIVLPMIYHVLHDIINMMFPTNATGAMLQESVTVSDLISDSALGITMLVLALYMLRKVNFDDIKNTWATIWNE